MASLDSSFNQAEGSIAVYMVYILYMVYMVYMEP